jgi:hypothetical protein
MLACGPSTKPQGRFMTAPASFPEALGPWLASEDGLAALDAAARQIWRRLRCGGLRRAMDRLNIVPGTPSDSAVEELRGEVCRFVLENSHRLAPGLAAVPGHAGAYLCRAFINHCLDLERRPGGDPFRFRYRQFAEAMRRDDGFWTEKNPSGGIRFSLSPASRLVAPLAEEDLEAIGPPPADCTGKAGRLLACARYFWRALAARFGGQAIWVNLRDLIQWLGFYGCLATAPSTVALTDEVANFLAAPAAAAVDLSLVRGWAAMFAQSLAPRDRRLWALRFGRHLGLKEIAAQTGAYSGSSGVHERLRRLQEKLRDFIQTHDLPWLSPEDGNAEARAAFYHALLDAVENHDATPFIQGKGPPRKRARHHEELP